MANPFPFSSGDILTAANLNSIGEWTSFTPDINKVSDYGTGAVRAGIYATFNELCVIMFAVTFGTSPTFDTGNWKMDLPVASDTATHSLGNLGSAIVRIYADSNGNRQYYLSGDIGDGTTDAFTFRTGVQGSVGGNLQRDNIYTIAATDRIHGIALYPIAAS